MFLRPDPDTTITEPANNLRSITVSGYDLRTGSFYIESGRGFTRTMEIKPDFAAPAVEVFGVNALGNYVARSGTSLAAALTAGLCAQLYEWGIVKQNFPFMTAAAQKNFFLRGADRSGQTELISRTFGYGKINIYESFLSLLLSDGG